MRLRNVRIPYRPARCRRAVVPAASKSGGLSKIVSSLTLHNVMAARRSRSAGCPYQPFPVDRLGEEPEGKAPFCEAAMFNEYADYRSVLYSWLHIGSGQGFSEASAHAPRTSFPRRPLSPAQRCLRARSLADDATMIADRDAAVVDEINMLRLKMALIQ
jgi:hypothetical protein